MNEITVEGYKVIVALMSQEITSLQQDVKNERQIGHGHEKTVELREYALKQQNSIISDMRGVLLNREASITQLEYEVRHDATTIKILNTQLEKKSSKVKQVMKVPNSQYGRDIIHKMKKHLGKDKKIVCRGRNHKDGVPRAVSYRLEDCNEIGIYIEEK
jgi:hypothetical protein